MPGVSNGKPVCYVFTWSDYDHALPLTVGLVQAEIICTLKAWAEKLASFV